MSTLASLLDAHDATQSAYKAQGEHVLWAVGSTAYRVGVNRPNGSFHPNTDEPTEAAMLLDVMRAGSPGARQDTLKSSIARLRKTYVMYLLDMGYRCVYLAPYRTPPSQHVPSCLSYVIKTLIPHRARVTEAPTATYLRNAVDMLRTRQETTYVEQRALDAIAAELAPKSV